MEAFQNLTEYKLDVSRIEEWNAVDIKLREPRFNLSISPSDAGFGFSQILPLSFKEYSPKMISYA